jgi:hypothetical protein
VLALTRSPDLKTWETRCILLYHPQQDTHGFQYVDWQIEGEDLLVVSRTSYDDSEGPRTHRSHDANFLTFHRFPEFRTLSSADSVSMNNPATRPAASWSVGDVTVAGSFERGLLANGERAFSNRAYTWSAVPEKLHGMRITRLRGGEVSPLTVSATKSARIFVAAAEPGKLDLADFELQPDLTFHYTDGGRTAVSVFARELKAGETLLLPSGNWTGCMLLLPR